MKTTIYIVSYVNFDGYDDNLYHTEAVFTNNQKARKVFKQECAIALSYAKFEDGSDDNEGVYTVNEEQTDADEYKVSRTEGTYYTEVKLKKMDIDVPYTTDRRKYGMPIEELRDIIADFTGDKNREAMRKAKIFAKHISLRHVSDIVSISYGHRTDEHGHRTEDRNWLQFCWQDLEGDSDIFSIIE